LFENDVPTVLISKKQILYSFTTQYDDSFIHQRFQPVALKLRNIASSTFFFQAVKLSSVKGSKIMPRSAGIPKLTFCCVYSVSIPPAFHWRMDVTSLIHKSIFRSVHMWEKNIPGGFFERNTTHELKEI